MKNNDLVNTFLDRITTMESQLTSTMLQKRDGIELKKLVEIICDSFIANSNNSFSVKENIEIVFQDIGTKHPELSEIYIKKIYKMSGIEESICMGRGRAC